MKAQHIGHDNGTQNATDGAQLSKLSAVLNGLEAGAQIMRHQAQQVMAAVKSGTYQVDPTLLSRRIVGEFLGHA